MKKQKLPLLSYFYNKEKFEQSKKEIEDTKASIPKELLDFLKGKQYHFTVYSQRRKND